MLADDMQSSRPYPGSACQALSPGSEGLSFSCLAVPAKQKIFMTWKLMTRFTMEFSLQPEYAEKCAHGKQV
eukprot:925504-Pelagomonas_calceolata.AAC.1